MSDTTEPISEYIPLSECKHGWLYKIDSRNLILGVFIKDNNGFIGIREKFGNFFLFVEYHWDTGPPLGTVKPLEVIEACPVENLGEYIETRGRRDVTNNELFDYLKNKGGMPPEYINRRKHLRDIEILQKLKDQQRK